MLSGILRWSRLAALIWWAGTFWAFMLYGLAFVAYPTLWVPISCTIAGMVFVILIHETGHAAAAIACGWRVLVFAVCPFGLHLPTRTITFLPRGYREDAGGFVASVPRSQARGTRARRFIIVASGPAACFVLAGAALVVRELWLRGIDTRLLVASNFGLAIAVQACVSGLISLLPYDGSDGEKLLVLARPDPERLLHAPCGWMATQLHYNVRLRDLPEWLIAAQRAVPHPGAEPDRHGEGIDIGRILDADRPDFARARERIDAYRTRYGGSAWLDSCDAYLAAIGEGDAVGAAARLWKGESDPGAQSMEHAARASVLAVQGHEAGMQAELRAMRKAVRARSPYRNATFRDIERRIRAALRPA